MGRIEDIEQRAEKATKGPWKEAVDFFEPDDLDRCFQVEPVMLSDGFSGGYRWLSEKDAKFIAHSREDIPWLLSEVKRLEAKRKEIEDAAEMLWVVLANVSEGDWKRQSIEWQEAAIRWRDNYYKALSHAQAQGEGKE